MAGPGREQPQVARPGSCLAARGEFAAGQVYFGLAEAHPPVQEGALPTAPKANLRTTITISQPLPQGIAQQPHAHQEVRSLDRGQLIVVSTFISPHRRLTLADIFKYEGKSAPRIAHQVLARS